MTKMKIKHKLLIHLICFFAVFTLWADGKQYVIGTWNMKWLDGSIGKLDDTKNLWRYTKEIIDSKATLFAIQEISPSHSENEVPKCHYLDLIVAELNKVQSGWIYVIDSKNEAQRLGFLYNHNKWTLFKVKSIVAGNAFNHRMRKPFCGMFQSVENPQFTLNIINIHLKAFSDGTETRQKQFVQLADWIKTNNLAMNTIICGDTNIYKDEIDPATPLNGVGFIEAKSEQNTAIHENKLSQRFDRFYLSQSLRDKNYFVEVKQGSANVNYMDYSDNVSDHLVLILVIEY